MKERRLLKRSESLQAKARQLQREIDKLVGATADLTVSQKPPAWVGLVGVVLVAAALTLASWSFVTTKAPDDPIRTNADIAGAVLIVISVVAQSTMVMWDQWGLRYSTALMSVTVIASIIVAIVGADLVVMGALQAHGALPVR
jgi:uncharacterized membrane protein HdeD (DUF308 family)